MSKYGGSYSADDINKKKKEQTDQGAAKPGKYTGSYSADDIARVNSARLQTPQNQPARQYLITGNKAQDAANAQRVQAGNNPVYTSTADMRNQLRLDKGLGLSVDKTPVPQTTEQQAAGLTGYIKELQNKQAELDTQMRDMQNQWAESSRNYGIIAGKNERESYKEDREAAVAAYNKAQKQKEYLQGLERIAKDNETGLNVIMNGDEALFTKYLESKELAEAEARKKKYQQEENENPLGDLLRKAANLPDINESHSAADADQYLREIKDKGYTDEQIKSYINFVNDKDTEDIRNDFKRFAEKHPVASEVIKVATSPVRGVFAAQGMILKPGERNTGYNLLNAYSEAVTETNTQAIQDAVKSNVDGKAGAFLAWAATKGYQAATASAESLITMGLGGPLGEVLMGLNAATQTYNEGLEKGLSAARAIDTALAAGIFETLFEHLSLENLRALKASGKTGFGNACLDILKQFVTEGSEEVFTDMANELYDYLMNGGMSNYERTVQEYVDGGMNEQDAQKKYAVDFAVQLGESMLVGGLSGGMSATSVVGSRVAGNTASYIGTGKAVQNAAKSTEGGIKSVLSPLTEALGESNERKALEGITEKTGKYKTGRAVSQAVNAITETQVKTAKDALTAVGIDEKTADKKARTFVSMYDGNITAETVAAFVELANDEKSMSALTELLGDETEYQGRRTALDTFRKNVIKAAEQHPTIIQRAAERLDRWVRRDEIQKAAKRGEIADASKEAVAEKNTENLVEQTKAEAAGGKVMLGGVADVTDGKVQVVVDPETKATMDLDEVTFPQTKEGIRQETIYKAAQQMMTGAGEYSVPMSATAANLAIALAQQSTEEPGQVMRDLYTAYTAGTVVRNRQTYMHENELPLAEEASMDAMYAAGVKEYKPSAGVTRVGTEDLTEKQVNELKVLDRVFRKMGIALVVTDTLYAEVNGKLVRLYGETDGSTIYVGLRDGKTHAENIISVAAFHELFHWIQYGGKVSKGVQRSLVQAVIRTIKNQKDLNYDEIYEQRAAVYTDLTQEEIEEEIAAQYFGTLMADRLVATEMFQGVEQSAWEKIMNHVQGFFMKVHEAIEAFAKGTNDRAMIAAINTDLDAAEHLLKSMDVALKVTMEERTKAETETGEQTEAEPRAGPETEQNRQGDIAQQSDYSRALDMQMMDDADALNEEFIKKGISHVSPQTMYQARRVRYVIKNLLQSAEYDANGNRKLLLPEDIAGKGWVKNGAYGRTVEPTTVCPRSIGFDRLSEMIAGQLGRPLTVEESLAVAQNIGLLTNEIQCLYCYVAADRMAYNQAIIKFINDRDVVMEMLRSGNIKTEAEFTKEYLKLRGVKKASKPIKALVHNYMEAYRNGGKLIQISDMTDLNNSEARLADIRERLKDSGMLDEFEALRSYAQSATWAKKRVDYMAYSGDILTWKEEDIKALNEQFGLRFYSFSDFSAAFILDNMQTITDAAVRGLKGLAYTKATDFVRIFAPTHININVSVFGQMVDGQMVADEMQGANWDETKALRSKYKNVGAVFVAMDDASVEWALAQDWIDVVIPYHTVHAGGRVTEFFNWEDYKASQEDRKAKGWKKGMLRSIPPHLHNNDRETYMRLLEENHLTPRFPQWIGNENYMKLVNETRRSAAETPTLQPVFDEKAARASIKAMEKSGSYLEPLGGSNEAMQAFANVMSQQLQVTDEADLRDLQVESAAFAEEMGRLQKEAEDTEPESDDGAEEYDRTVEDEYDEEMLAGDIVHKYSRLITDQSEIDRLNSEETITLYRSMVMIGGKLYSPMATYVDGKLGASYEIGKWYRSDERIDLAYPKYDENGNPKIDKNTGEVALWFDLVKGGTEEGEKAGTVPARYNPYEHQSNSPINDQFSAAYKRPNLVVVEFKVPKSEERGEYRAKSAKDPTGWVEWKSGKASNDIKKAGGEERKVFLSRWAMPARVLTDAEVAQEYKKRLAGTNVKVKDNTVTPGLRAELEKIGVPIEITGIIEEDQRKQEEAARKKEESARKKAEEKRQKEEKKKNASEIHFSRALDDEHMAAVEAGDEATQARLVEQAAEKAMPDSKIRTKDGKLRVVYHGTDTGNFTVFDWERTQRADAGWFGRGFYFAFTKNEAKEYGRRVIDAYLDIRKPFVFNKEMYRYDGTNLSYDENKKSRPGHSMASDVVAFWVNSAEKFPEIFGDRTLDVYDNETGEARTIRWKDVRGEVEKILNSKNFIARPFVEYRGDEEREYYVWSYDYGGFSEAHTYAEYDTKEAAEADKINAAIEIAFTRMLRVNMPTSTAAYYLGGDMDTADAFTKALQKKGYDGVLQTEDGDEIVAFTPEQIKSADPVTYDDKGKVIPLSERFNPEKEDIRYSRVLNQEAQEYVEGLEQENRNQATMIRELQAVVRTLEDKGKKRTRRMPQKNKLMELVRPYIYNDPEDKQHRGEVADRVAQIIQNIYDGKTTFQSAAVALSSVIRDEVRDAGHWEDIGDDTVVRFRRALRTENNKPRTVYLAPDIFKTVAENYGGRRAFQQAWFGKLTFTNDRAKSTYGLDSLYDELRKDGFGLENTTDPTTQLDNMMALYKTDTRKWVHDAVDDYLTGMSEEEVVTDRTLALFEDILTAMDLLTDVENVQHKERIRQARENMEKAKRLRLQMVKAEAQEEIERRMNEAAQDKNATTTDIEGMRSEIETDVLREKLIMDYERRTKEKVQSIRESAITDVMRREIRGRVRKISDMLLKNTVRDNVPQLLRKQVRDIIAPFITDGAIFTAKEQQWLKIELERFKAGTGPVSTYDFSRFSEDLYESFREVVEDMRDAGGAYGMALDTLTPEQVKVINAFTENVLYVLNDANISFLDNRNGDTLLDGAKAVQQMKTEDEARTPKQRKRELGLISRLMKNGYLTSVYFFKEKLGGVIAEYFDAFLEAESRSGLKYRQVLDFMEDAKERYKAKDWAKKKHAMRLTCYESKIDPEMGALQLGTTTWDVELPVESCMMIYAWYKRERLSGQKSSHIVPRVTEDGEVYGGGVVLSSDLIKAQNKFAVGLDAEKAKLADGGTKRGNEAYQEFLKQHGADVNAAADNNRHLLTAGAVEQIISKLTENEKAYVDTVVDFLSNVCSEWGNEASMKWFGLRLFEEDYYFPYENPTEFSSRRNGISSEKLLRNWGASKRTQVQAKTPLVLSSFTDVAARHMAEMVSYSEFLIPVEQMSALLSYNALDEQDTSVQAMIKTLYGSAATKYIEDFMSQINGGVRGDDADAMINRLTSLFKGAAVMANASVVFQQPSAIMRAMGMIKAKYFATTGLRPADYNEMLKYSGVAMIKELGGFDTNMGGTIADQISGKKTVRTVVNDIAGWGAGKADSLTWTHIWNAVKREQADMNRTYDETDRRWETMRERVNGENPGLIENETAFNEAIKHELFMDDVRRRFEEVIRYTQVYDSMISKNAWMRNKSGLVKMVTAFMGEPTLSLNMLMMSGKGHKMARSAAIRAFILNIIVNSLLQGIVGAWRHRKEDESYLEAYLRESTENLIGDVNVGFLNGAWSPLAMIPEVKDIISIMQGYDVERSDMAAISDIWKAFQKVIKGATGGDGDITTWQTPDTEDLMDLAFSISAVAGVPVGRMVKDGISLYKSITASFVDPQWKYAGESFWAAFLEGVGIDEANEKKAYNAVMHNDVETIRRMTMVTDEDVDKLIAKEGYSEAEAVKQAQKDAQDAFDKLAAEGLIKYDKDQRVQKAAKNLYNGAPYYLDIYEDIRQSLIEDGFSNNAVQKAIDSEIEKLRPQEEKEATEAKEKEPYTKKNLEDAMEQRNVAAFEAIGEKLVDIGTLDENGVLKYAENYAKNLYEAGGTRSDAEYLLRKFAGYSTADSVKIADLWEFHRQNPASELTESQIRKYEDYAKPANVSLSVFEDFVTTVSGISGEDKQKRVVELIKRTAHTREQRLALWFAAGYKESTFDKQNWTD